MNPKSGSPGSAVSPTDPNAANDADNADPGKIAEVKREQRETESGKYGTEQVEPFKAPAGEDGDDPKSWIEIELVDEEDEPVPGEKYKVTLPDGRVAEGTLDQNGWARIEGFEPGQCAVCFPKLDEEAWEFIESTGAREGG